MLRKAWLFLMTLGHSRHMYCRLVFDQKVSTWVRLHVEAFEHFGGVPRVIVPDNLKAAVIRAAFAVDDEPAIQRTYRELARHYGFRSTPLLRARRRRRERSIESWVTRAAGLPFSKLARKVAISAVRKRW